MGLPFPKTYMEALLDQGAQYPLTKEHSFIIIQGILLNLRGNWLSGEEVIKSLYRV